VPLDLARRLAIALNIRSESAIRDIDRVLSDYSRLVPQASATPVEGSIAASQVISGTFNDARIAESSVTQHEGALSIKALPGIFRLTGRLTDTITGDENDYDPNADGLAGLSVLEVTPDGGNHTITGFAGGVAGRILCVLNMDASNNLVLAHQDSGSDAANRIVHAQGINETLPELGCAVLLYSSDSRWHVLADAL